MRRLGLGAGSVVLAAAWSGVARAQEGGLLFPRIELGVASAEGPADVALTLQIVALLTVLTLAPAILVMLTSFTRIVVVLSFVRSALALQQMPPNQVIIGLALFLTFFTMAPTWQAVYEQGVQPYLAGQLSEAEAFQQAMGPLREFMLQHTRERDLELFVELSGGPRPVTEDDLPTHVIIPAFVISELRTAFQLGFILFIPFLVIDMVVASTLMSMGMLMLPPVMISLPFKVLLFVMVDGWHLITRSLLVSFQ
ncbi:MAG TPA: flagellar type III secretion system pore protein FliP [Limnochordales bacterium]